jgi:hypothetical protein
LIKALSGLLPDQNSIGKQYFLLYHHVKNAFMKKIKFGLISIAIVGAIVGAFATTNFKAPCEYMDQYVNINGTWTYAGTYGLDYYCVGSVGICTWYKPWPSSDWTPCRAGSYFPLSPLNKKK